MRTIALILLLAIAGILSWRRGGRPIPEDSFHPMNFDEGMAVGFLGSAVAAGALAIAWAAGLGELLEGILSAALQ